MNSIVNNPASITLDEAEAKALEQFRADAKRLADEANRGCGLVYELYAARFSGACDPYIQDLDPTLRPAAIEIAREFGYEEESPDFEPGTCSLTGIDPYCCPCGRHE